VDRLLSGAANPNTLKGARIRFEPEASWPTNAGTTNTLGKLQPIMGMFPNVSAADIIVLAGITALAEMSGDLELSFCGGYVDAADGEASKFLAPRLYPTAAKPDYVISVLDDFKVKGLTKEEGVVLACRERVGSQYFIDLKTGNGEFDEFELALLDNEFLSIVDAYAADDSMVKSIFTGAWTKMMTADRYGAFRKNACDTTTVKEEPGELVNTKPARGACFGIGAVVAVGLVLFLVPKIW
jgi:Peroxidase